jgi:CsoR family transcriptional regulator, copper-sensing transcriptional repressor
MAKTRTPAKALAAERRLEIEDDTAADIILRLRRVEGQVRAIEQMIEQRRDCHTIAQLMGAAKSALERATVQLMTASMAGCLSAGRNGAYDQRELARLTDTFVKILG